MMSPIGTFMRRRDFMTSVVGASAVACPFAAHAQQATKIARIGYLAEQPCKPGPARSFPSRTT